MSTPTISVTESMLMTAMGNWLITLTGFATTNVVRAYDNLVAMPTGDWVEMATLRMKNLNMNNTSWNAGNVNPGQELNQLSRDWVCQLDFYGPNAAENAAIVSEMARTENTWNYFEASYPYLQPLYAEDPIQTPFVNDQGQYEKHYAVELHAQFNPVVIMPLDFADQLEVTLVEVDATFPPEN